MRLEAAIQWCDASVCNGRNWARSKQKPMAASPVSFIWHPIICHDPNGSSVGPAGLEATFKREVRDFYT